MTLLRRCGALAWMVAAAVLVAGCKQSTEKLEKGTETYDLRGKVLGVDRAKGEIVLQHDAVPGFMPAMTMPYQLLYGEIATELHEGDMIHARLKVEKDSDGEYHNAKLDEVAVIAQARPDVKPQTHYNVPTAGAPVPDFHFRNQDGKPVSLSSFHGKAVLITFIYTRCPLGDFCPRMSRNFAAIQARLCRTAALCASTQMLSISFDPAFDTSSVLRAYGSTYVGKAGFTHWQFLAPTVAALPAVEQYFNLGATGSDASLTHSLSTTLVGPDGKVVAWYPGSEWSVDEVAARMEAVAATTPGKGANHPA